MKPFILGFIVIIGSIFFVNATANAEDVLSSSEYMQKETAALYEFCSSKATDPRIKSQMYEYVRDTFKLTNSSDDFLESFAFDMCMAAKTNEVVDSWHQLLNEAKQHLSQPDTKI